MSDFHSFPKIFPVGSDYIPRLFDGDVEITEKIDGSQFGFGLTADSKLVFRSRGKQMYFENHEKMFGAGAKYLQEYEAKIHELLRPNTYLYGEFLNGPHHNVLTYERIPQNHIMVFGMIREGSLVKSHAELVECAGKLDLECVPLLYSGPVKLMDELNQFMERDSVLGKEKLEGIVIKNYAQVALVGNLVMPCFAKLVRAAFKERLSTSWTPAVSRVDSFIETFRSEARWLKAVQHLREKGELLNDPKDIGPLLREIHLDIVAEEQLNIKNELYGLFIDQIKRKACAGFPEWYKGELAKRAFPAEVAA